MVAVKSESEDRFRKTILISHLVFLIVLCRRQVTVQHTIDTSFATFSILPSLQHCLGGKLCTESSIRLKSGQFISLYQASIVANSAVWTVRQQDAMRLTPESGDRTKRVSASGPTPLNRGKLSLKRL